MRVPRIAASKDSGRKPYCIWDAESADAWHASPREVQDAWDAYVQREVDIWNEREGTYDRGAHLYYQWTPPLSFAEWRCSNYMHKEGTFDGTIVGWGEVRAAKFSSLHYASATVSTSDGTVMVTAYALLPTLGFLMDQAPAGTPVRVCVKHKFDPTNGRLYVSGSFLRRKD